jgi:drug/metabolite transporter (DMT)-like permease
LLAALSGFCCVTAYQLLSTYGIKTVASGPASVLVDTMPIFTTLFSVFILKHRPKWRTWTGMSVAFAGAMIIALGESGGQLRINLGAGLLLLAALLFSLGTIAQKPIMKRYDPLGVTAVSFSAGALGMIPFSPNFLETAQAVPFRQLAMIGFLAVGPGALAYALWANALSKLPVSKASASLFLIAPLTYLVAWIIFHAIAAMPLGRGGRLFVRVRFHIDWRCVRGRFGQRREMSPIQFPKGRFQAHRSPFPRAAGL